MREQTDAGNAEVEKGIAHRAGSLAMDSVSGRRECKRGEPNGGRNEGADPRGALVGDGEEGVELSLVAWRGVGKSTGSEEEEEKGRDEDEESRE